MCLAIPMQVIKIEANGFAQVKVGGVNRRINVEMSPGLKLGDYVMVHAGFAIEKVDPVEARRTLELFREVSGDKG